MSSIGQGSLNQTQRATNIKTRSNVNILSTIANQKKSQNSGSLPANQLPMSSGQSHLSAPPQKIRQPMRADKKIGRNEPCPCGSGKKYKKCHG